MFQINDDNSIYVTRGDAAVINVSLANIDGSPYTFSAGDVLRLKVFEKKNCSNVVLEKLFTVEEETEEVSLFLDERDTKIGEVISKPVDYWYEIELNPLSNPQTVICYDEEGAKIFKLFPEGRDLSEDEEPIQPRIIPFVDKELDLTSTRPVERISTLALTSFFNFSVTKGIRELPPMRIMLSNGNFCAFTSSIIKRVLFMVLSIRDSIKVLSSWRVMVRCAVMKLPSVEGNNSLQGIDWTLDSIFFCSSHSRRNSKSIMRLFGERERLKFSFTNLSQSPYNKRSMSPPPQ